MLSVKHDIILEYKLNIALVVACSLLNFETVVRLLSDTILLEMMIHATEVTVGPVRDNVNVI
jgi:hypothetical protein